jgi:hypothetical protein
LHFFQLLIRFLERLLIVGFVSQFDQNVGVFEDFGQSLPGLRPGFQAGDFLQDALGLIGVAPEIGRSGFLLQFGNLSFLVTQVKGNPGDPGGGRSIWRWLL